MATARNTVIQPVDFQLPVPQIPLELLAQKIESAQGQYDEFGQLTALQPQYLKEHSADAVKLKQFTDTVSNDVSAAFASGDTGKAMRMLQQGKDVLKKQFSPGGLAYALQSAYDADIEAKKQLQERFKEDLRQGNNINYQLAQMQYKVPELGYDPTTGVFNKPSAPDVPTYFDYNKEMRDWISKVDPRKYGYVQYGDKYINEVTGEQYNMQQFAAKFMDDPRVRQQMFLEGQYNVMSLPPEERQARVAQLNEASLKSAESLKSSLATLESNLNSKDKQTRMKAQAELASRGYEVDGKVYGRKDIDGDVGNRTKAALAQLKSEIENYQPQQFTENDLASIYANERATGLSAMAQITKPSWEMTKYAGANPYTMEAVKHAHKQQEQKQLVDQWASIQQATAMPTASTAIDLNLMDKAIKATEESVTASKNALSQAISTNPALSTIFSDPNGKLSPEDVAAGIRMSLDKNHGNVEAAAKELGMSVEKVQQAHSIFQRPEYTSFSESAMSLADSHKSMEQIKATDNEVKKIFVERNGKEFANDFVKKKGWDRLYGVTGDMLLNNPEQARKLVKRPASILDINPYIKSKNDAKDPIAHWFIEFNDRVSKDIKANNDAYKTALPTGLRSDSKQFSMIENNWHEFANMPDEFNTSEWKIVNGEGAIANPEIVGKPSIQIQPAIGKPGKTIVMIGQTKDGKTVEKRSYVADPAQTDYINKELSGMLADAMNQNDMSTAMKAISILEGDDILGQRISPTANGSVRGNYVRTDNKGNASTATNFQFNEVKSFENIVTNKEGVFTDGNIALITLPGATKDSKQWAVVKKVGNTVYELEDVQGKGKAVYDSYTKANAAFALLREAKQHNYTGTQVARTKVGAVPPPVITE